jgi:pseudaminic acid biosynthesis-associated methylase
MENKMKKNAEIQNYTTEQENFWAGSFGDQYIDRNRNNYLIANNITLFSKILANTSKVSSVLEVGANIGLNLHAIKSLLPEAKLAAIEINQQAVKELSVLDDIKVFHQSILDFQPDSQYDLVFSKGVLIHINPNELSTVYNTIFQSSSRYICIAEYYNPNPIELSYRGHSGKLFKRDFAGEMLEIFPDLRLVNYGFVWRRDIFPQDDITWFLLEKQ